MTFNKMWPRLTTFIFVTDGMESAFEKAKATAGDKNVTVMGAITGTLHKGWTSRNTDSPHARPTRRRYPLVRPLRH
jgi:hypothetical protein